MKDLSQTEWKSQLEASQNAAILDVRRPEEWEEGIIPNSLTIDILNTDLFISEIEKLNKDIPYFIYCKSGARSHQACLILEQMGFKETFNLEGGILEWKGKVQ